MLDPSSRGFVCLAALVLAVVSGSGCQCVSGIDTRYVDPALYTLDDGGQDAPPPGCTFSDDGDTRVRFVNGNPGDERVHLCVKPTSEEQWPDRPLTRGVGADCPAGVGYKQVTAPRALAMGGYDLKVVSSAASDCAEAGLAELGNVETSKQVTTVLYARRNATEALLALPEDDDSFGNVRFVHVLDGPEVVDVYLADEQAWPPARGLSAVSDLPFGALASDESKSELVDISKTGYVRFYGGRGAVRFGAVESKAAGPEPTSDAAWLVTVRDDWDSHGPQSAFAVGRIADPEFPPEFVVCEEGKDDGLWTACESHVPESLATTILHTTLSGIDYTGYRVRAEQMGAAVAGADTDLMCLMFVMSDDDKRDIEATAGHAGFNVAWAQMDLDTEFVDPRRFDGTTPVAPEVPPCSGQTSLKLATDLIDCLVENCTGDRANALESTECLGEYCFNTAVGGMAGGAQQKRCGMCLALSLLDGSPLSRVEEMCTADTRAGMSFEGKSGVMLLSRHPIRDVEHWALPSWAWRSSVAKATVDVPNKEPVDLYCTQLTTSTVVGNFPYVGDYGDGPLGASFPWTNQALLQATRLLELVKTHSGPRAAIVAGAIESGLECPECQPPLEAFGPEVVIELLKHLGLGTALDYTWQCLECADNPLRAIEQRADANLWTDHILTRGFARTDVIATSRVFEESTMALPIEGETVMVPPSTHYGLRSTIGAR